MKALTLTRLLRPVPLACVLLLLSGCELLFENEITRDNIEGYSVYFKPDVVKDNVAWWYFDFLETNVLGCNSNGNEYPGTDWSFDEEAQTVRVYFGSAWEEYELVEITDDAFRKGRFNYSNSNGAAQSKSGIFEVRYLGYCAFN